MVLMALVLATRYDIDKEEKFMWPRQVESHMRIDPNCM